MIKILLVRFFSLSVALTLLFAAPGCMKTTYTGFENRKGTSAFGDRRVHFQISNEYYRNPPECVFITSPGPDIPRVIRYAVEDAVERNLNTRVERVISRRQALSMARQMAVDLSNKTDRKIFSRKFDCKVFADIDIKGFSDQFLLIWAKRSMRLSLRMISTETGKTLWESYHAAGRSDGSLPLSPISAALSIVRATRVNADNEIFRSIADDAVRRMVARLPDVRGGTGKRRDPLWKRYR